VDARDRLGFVKHGDLDNQFHLCYECVILLCSAILAEYAIIVK
jgi:hypothetical protein